MKRHSAFLAGALALALVSGAAAQTYPQVKGPNGTGIAPQATAGTAIDPSTGSPCAIGSSPTCLGDTNDSAFGGVVPLTVGTPDTQARRSLGFVCTSSGSLTLLLPDGSSITVPIQGSPYFQTLPFATFEVSAGTATCANIWNLK